MQNYIMIYLIIAWHLDGMELFIPYLICGLLTFYADICNTHNFLR